MLDSRVKENIGKVKFHHDEEYDKVFPAKRLSRAEITLKSGEKFKSRAYEPDGDCNEKVSINDIEKRYLKLTDVIQKKIQYKI